MDKSVFKKDYLDKINGVEKQFAIPIKAHTWIDETLVNNCHNCNRVFTLFTRKHHCRRCGRVFCHYCCNTRDEVPQSLLSDDSKKGTWSDFYRRLTNADTKKYLICVKCHELIKKINSVKMLTTIFQIVNFNIHDLQNMAKVSENWMIAANYCIAKIRDIQFKLPTDNFNERERKILITNRDFLIGHNRYIIQLIKNSEIDDIYRILHEKKRMPCNALLCCKNCSPKLLAMDVINLLGYMFRCGSRNQYLFRLILEYLVCDDGEFKCYLPFLVYNLKNDVGDVISDFLVERCFENYSMLNHFYWELQMYNGYSENGYIRTLDRVKKKLSESNRNQENFIRLLNTKDFIKNLDKLSRTMIKNGIAANQLTNSFNRKKNIYSPLNPDTKITYICIDDIKIKRSATRPLILPCRTDDGKTVKIMYKNENIRKDHIIMNIIKLVDYIVKREENIDLNIVTYNILPTSSTTGLIEIVEDCDTIYFIQEKMETSILNYILENNDSKPVSEIRSQFTKSTAAFCIITYLLGVGDRHLENIMVARDGRLFHIDYGYILGKDPIYKSSSIRITPEIVDALGGVNSKYYKQFKELCSKIYNCLRRNIDIFINQLLLLHSISDLELSEEQVIDHIVRKFMPGGDNLDAKLHITKQLENYQFTDKVKDWCHYHSKEKTLTKIWSRSKEYDDG